MHFRWEMFISGKYRHPKRTLCVTLMVIGIINILIQYRNYEKINAASLQNKNNEKSIKNNSMRDIIRKNIQYNNIDLHEVNVKLPTSHSTIYDCVTWLPLNHTNYQFKSQHFNNFSLRKIDKWKGLKEESNHRMKTFQTIFRKRDWLASDPASSDLQASGPGALLVNAQNAMATLHVIVTRLKHVLNKDIITLLDVPCGDLQWMKSFLMSRTDIQYHGMDIVPDLINHHIKMYGHVKRLRFSVSDIVTQTLDKSYDLILSRDLLQHLTIKDAGEVLKRFSDSKSRFLLVTTHPDTVHNTDVQLNQLGGRFSRYNLQAEPFSLAPPTCSSYDYNREHLALWSIPLQQVD